ncbi:Alpha-ketoglutarate-dependent dioxygenase alkB 2 [Branchiostoma belcheri]|nr:Alpha-ketoglutarate-dependent dioxygenase alkB 2 [Branchiostoma belcheri]KAI8484798.1 Alpha-ketoglutarate-dependent dioxygenase alkB 2 [Branchiostoma belcheri]
MASTDIRNWPSRSIHERDITSCSTDPVPLQWQKLREENFNCDYTVLYRPSVASTLFQACEEEFVYNTGDLARVQIFGKYRDIPREQVAFGDPGLSYRFSGVEIPARPWSPLLRTIKDRIQEVTGQEFNFVLINRYKDGLDYIGEHRDDEEGLVQNAPIASLSLGQKRDFIFKHCDARGKYKKRVVEPIKIELEHGSLLMMNYPTNRFWFHSLSGKRQQEQE